MIIVIMEIILQLASKIKLERVKIQKKKRRNKMKKIRFKAVGLIFLIDYNLIQF